MIIYGIKNCTTVKKALSWLSTNEIDFEFHDFKKYGIEEKKLKKWIDQVGLTSLINKQSKTWKTLDPNLQKLIDTQEGAAIKLMKEKTSIIKRPLLETSKGIILGFDEKIYEASFRS